MRISGRAPVLALLVLLVGAGARAQPFLGPETALARPDNPASGARVAVAGDGSFVAVWANRTTAPQASDVFVRLFGPDGNPRGAEFSVANQARGRQGGPGIAVAANGSFVVVWLVDVAPGAHRLFARRFDRDGHPRGGPFPVTVQPTPAKGDQVAPGAVIAPDGRILVIWTENRGVIANPEDGFFYDLKARWFADDGHALGGAFVLDSSFIESDLGRARFARDGSLTVVFQGFDGEGTFDDVYLRRFDASGAPLGEVLRINNDPETLETSQLEPDFAFGADGSLFVVWTDNGIDFVRHPGEHLVNRDSVGLVGQRVSATGAPLGPPIAINRVFRGEQEGASIEATADGGFFVVWMGGGGQDGSGFGVFGRRYDAAGTPVSREYTLPLQRANDQVFPQIALNSKGKGVVTWTTAASGPAAGAFRLFKE